MNGLYSTLEKIREKPGLYLGRRSLQALYFFLKGYDFSREELGLESTKEELFFYENFQEWLQSRFQVQTVSSWAKIIQLYSIDDRDAFENFFILLDEFLAKNIEARSSFQKSGEKISTAAVVASIAPSKVIE
jgi:hypothetical protein